jgi:hypothetical protein
VESTCDVAVLEADPDADDGDMVELPSDVTELDGELEAELKEFADIEDILLRVDEADAEES